MKRERVILAVLLMCSFLASGKVFSQSTDRRKPQYPNLPSETPDKFTPTNDGFDFIKRDVMIPMRDGVRLATDVYLPPEKGPFPVVFSRTP